MSCRILVGDVRARLADLDAGSVQCCVTSPPYFGLRDYGVAGQIGLEPTLADYLATMVDVFRDVRRVLRDDGVLWLNIGDSYFGTGKGPTPPTGFHKANGSTFYPTKGIYTHETLKGKDLMMVPARLAIALCDDGWYLRSDIIWHKRAPMPESVTDRPTSAHEHIFLLTKNARYFYDADAVRETSEPDTDARYLRSSFAGNKHGRTRVESGYAEGDKTHLVGSGRSLRNVWTLGPEPFRNWAVASRQVPVAWDEVDDDTTRTPSPNCPMHAYSDRSGPIHLGDEREADKLIRTADIDGYHDPSRRGGSAAIGPTPASDSLHESSDSQRPSDTHAAIARSTGIHKTEPQSVSCDMTGAEMSFRTEHRFPSHDSPGRDGCCIPGSSETLDDTSRSGTCTCSYHKTVTESISHFATFPTEIPRRCIKAGTSEKGACAACGAPWVRVTEKTDLRDRRSNPGQPAHLTPQGYLRDGGSRCGVNESITTGWAASCDCDAGTVPCVVLDPFGGSGTTALVADELGRDSILVELNPVYAEMSRSRVYGAAPMFASVEVA